MGRLRQSSIVQKWMPYSFVMVYLGFHAEIVKVSNMSPAS